MVVCFAFCSLKLILSEEICGRFGRFDVEIDAYRLSREVGASWWIDDESDKLHCFAAFVVSTTEAQNRELSLLFIE